MTTRTVSQLIEPQYALEGAGVLLRRSIAPLQSNKYDPFLLFDHFAFNDPVEKARHDKMVSLVEQMLCLHKEVGRIGNPQGPHAQERLERQIQVTDKAIDSLVYELYGLNEEEIKIVEGK